MTRTSIGALLATLGLVVSLAVVADAQDGGARGTRVAEVGQAFRVPYHLTHTNHYLVRVRINGKGPFNFLVDSGAPALFIGTAAAKAIDLEPAEDDFWTAVDRLDIEGGIALTDINARVEDPFQLVGMNATGLPGASIDGILGFTILARFRLEFDPTDDRMTWTRIDFTPREPFIPRSMRTKAGPAKPAELRAMEMLGPMMKVAALFTGGKMPEEQRLTQGYLGILLEAGDEVKVTAVLEGSPAAEAGVEAGDILARLDGRPVRSLDNAHAAIAELRPGQSIPLEIRRDGATRTLNVIAGEGL